jgi:SAM-dependent methyltransferase
MSVSVTTRDALLDTQRAFDGVAAEYDRSNETNPVIRWMRSRTIAAIARAVAPGGHLLDLGCGPGRDAATLAGLGYRVTAIDWSPLMVGQTLQRVTTSGLEGRVCVRHLGIHQLSRLDTGPFDGAYSDLGPLNCVPDLGAAAASLAEQLRPGGVLVASVIGRFCPWEMALYTAKGNSARATIRFEPDLVAVPLDGQTVWTRYVWPSEFESAFRGAGFRRVALHALGLAVPPPYLEGFAGRHPRLLAMLERLDDTIGGWPVFRNWGDHFLIVLQKS